MLRDYLATLAVVAQAEINAGTTQPLFDEHGELVSDEFTHYL